MLYQAAIKSIKRGASGIKIIEAGLMTTPMLYFLVNHFKTDLGIMITASHNPKEYNGLKIVGKNAIPISGEEIYKIVMKDEK
jgi:phosphomannomutase